MNSHYLQYDFNDRNPALALYSGMLNMSAMEMKMWNTQYTTQMNKPCWPHHDVYLLYEVMQVGPVEPHILPTTHQHTTIFRQCKSILIR